MGRNSFDILKRLGWIRNACEHIYGILALIQYTENGVPYVQVGAEAKVRVVLFAETRKIRVFYNVERTGEQEHMDFLMGKHGNVDDWVQLVAAFATGVAIANQKH